MEDNTFKTFHTISSFVKELQELYGKKYYNISLYNRILEKTPITNQTAIFKHISIFSEFIKKNRDAILEKNSDKLIWDRIIFSKKIYINIKDVLKESDTDTKNAIWKYLLAISFTTIQTDDIKEKIKELLLTPSSNNSNEEGKESDFIKNFMSKIENNFKDKEFKDPMSATAELFQSGIFTDMVQTMNQDVQDGKIDINKLLKSVQGMLGGLTNDMNSSGGGGGLSDMSGIFSMVTNVMGSMGGNNGGAGLDIGGLLGGLSNMGQTQSDTPSVDDLLKPITHETNDESKSS